MTAAVVGVDNHNGWANLVTVAMRDGEPRILDRRRVVLMDEQLPTQPYHHEALELPPDDGQNLVVRVRASASACARAALATLGSELGPDHTLTSMALRDTRFGLLPAEVAQVLAYRPLLYAADGMIYLEALQSAAQALGLAVGRHAKASEFRLAAQRLGLASVDVEAWFKGLGPALGPPWTQDHQRAAAAATALLPTET